MKKSAIPEKVMRLLVKNYGSGWTLAALAALANKHGCDVKLWHVRRALIKAGQPMRGKGGRTVGSTDLRIGSLSLDAVLQMRDRNMSLSEIGRLAGVTKQCVSQQLKNHAARVGS